MAFNRESFEHFWKHLEVLFGNKVDKEKGKSLMKDTEIARLASVKTGIELDTEDFELEEGAFITNADQLGGINAEDYVTEEELAAKLEEGVLTVNGQKGNVSITAESIGAITNINGVTPNEDGTFELNASNVGGLTVDLDGALEGQGPKINADLLAGKEASEYALVANIVTSVNGQTGDVVITEGGGQMDTTGFYSVSNPPPYPVTSVNGKTGAIEITAASLGAVTSVPVTSVNNKTGIVRLTADDVGALPNTYEPPVTSVNGQTGNVTITAPVTSVNGQTGDVTVTGAVQSVNGKSGTVVLTANDVKAMPDTYKAPVTSVNGQTGDVNISFSSAVSSVNGKTGAVTIPEIKYADVNFQFNGESLGCIGNLPSGLTDVGRIISILSHTNAVIITAVEIVNNQLWVYARNPSVVTVDDFYGNYIDYYTSPFSARVFYF